VEQLKIHQAPAALRGEMMRKLEEQKRELEKHISKPLAAHDSSLVSAQESNHGS